MEVQTIVLSPEEAFADVSFYTPVLKNDIVELIKEKVEEKGIAWLEVCMDRIFCLMSLWNAPDLNKEILRTVVALGDELICSTIGNVNTTEEMRSRAISCIHFISRLTTTI